MSFAKRCFISYLQTGRIIANSRESLVRIIGTVQSIESSGCDPENHKEFPGLQHFNEDFVILTLDDGTALANLWTPSSMIKNLSITGGETLECLARLYQRSKIRRWYTEALILVTDPNVEYMRWMELGNPPVNENESRRYGYPAKLKNAKEAYRLICLQCKLSTSGSSSTGSSTTTGQNGVSIKDLAIVMQIPVNEMEKMIQELQLNGQVYQNASGNFVPL